MKRAWCVVLLLLLGMVVVVLVVVNSNGGFCFSLTGHATTILLLLDVSAGEEHEP